MKLLNEGITLKDRVYLAEEELKSYMNKGYLKGTCPQNQPKLRWFHLVEEDGSVSDVVKVLDDEANEKAYLEYGYISGKGPMNKQYDLTKASERKKT